MMNNIVVKHAEGLKIKVYLIFLGRKLGKSAQYVSKLT